MPEGNIAVMLTDINLTPDSQLGRMLYNFSATMYEIADGYNLEDLNNLGIIDIPNSVNVFINGTDINGNISQKTEEANTGNKKSNKIGQTTFSFKGTDSDLINGYFEDKKQESYNPNDL